MHNSLLRRAYQYILTLVVILVITFLLPRALPASPVEVMAGTQLTQEEVQRMIVLFGLDKPLWEQFVFYIINLAQGNFGISYRYYPIGVGTLILQALPWTLLLLVISRVVVIALGYVIGIFAAWRKGSKVDMFIEASSAMLLSLPGFWIAIILILTFSFYLRIFPISGAFSPNLPSSNFVITLFDVLHHLALPVITLVLGQIGAGVLIMRSSVIEVLREDYMVTAEAKGLGNREIMFKHAARNALIPFVTHEFSSLGFIVGAQVFIETVFGYPGIGKLMFDAVSARDYPLIQGSFFLVGLIVIFSNFLADVLYLKIDPRIRVLT